MNNQIQIIRIFLLYFNIDLHSFYLIIKIIYFHVILITVFIIGRAMVFKVETEDKKQGLLTAK